MVVEAPRKPLFKSPRVREDLRALPQMFASRRLLWVPLGLLLIGFVVNFWAGAFTGDAAAIPALYVQFFFYPPALFTFFIAGYVAPRASYLVGLIYGLIAAGLWIAAILGPGMTTPDGALPETEPGIVTVNMLMIGALYGTLAGAFAGWYRDFLKGMREKGAQRRAEREQQERIKRRQSRREARRPSG